jgi:ferrochelatase
MTTGVLLMAYGSPENLDDMGAYLLDIRGGRPTPLELVEEMRRRYAQIPGGRSPLLRLTQEQAGALEAELNRRFAGQEFRAYLGMRHWEPRIKEAAARMAEEGITRAVGLVMAPHSSRMSTGAYFKKLEEAIAELGVDLEIIRIESWHDHPGLIAAIAEKAVAALDQFGLEKPYVIFTAHSLPSRILAQGDPYETQLRETAGLIAARLDLPAERWGFSYQSAGQSAEPWLGPQIEETVQSLVAAGEKNLLVVPVGFVCDHVEVLYDIDIAARALAERGGARLERSGSLNASPTFIKALADLVESSLETQPAENPVDRNVPLS